MGQNQSYNQKRQATIVPNSPKLLILTSTEAREALSKAERSDFFHRDVEADPINSLARAGLDYYPVNGPELRIDTSWLQNDLQICWMSPSAEAGMPHTRDTNVVCMPIYWPESQLLETLKHEAIHVDQRLRPLEWVKWCTSNGWTLVNEKEIPERWRRLCRLNPDTMKFRFWAFKNRWVPLPMYEREDKPKLREVQVRWWDKKTGDLLLNTPLELKELTEGIHNPEHPFEIAAYRFIQI